MFEPVIWSRQVVRGGCGYQTAKLGGCKLRFESLCELESFVSISLLTSRTFLRADPNVHYGAQTQATLLIWKALQKYSRMFCFKAKARKIRDWCGMQCCAVVLLQKPTGWKKWWLSCQSISLLQRMCQKTGEEKRQPHWLYWLPAAGMTEWN